jgi:hypothetical protein
MSVDEDAKGDVGGVDDAAVGVVDCAETVGERAGLTLGAVALPALGRGACDVQATSIAGRKITAATLPNLMRASMALVDLPLGAHRPGLLETHRALERRGAQFLRQIDRAAKVGGVDARLRGLFNDPADDDR